METFKHGITMQTLERKIEEQAQEIARLRSVQNFGESVARLPIACVENLTEEKVKMFKENALHDALMDLKSADKGRNDLILQIEDLEMR